MRDNADLECIKAIGRKNNLNADDITELAAYAESSDAEARSLVAEILVSSDSDISRRILIKLADDSDDLVRANACDSLGIFYDAENLCFLMNIARTDACALVRTYAVLSAGAILYMRGGADKEYASELERLLRQETNIQTKTAALSALYRLGKEKYLDDIIETLLHNDYRVRCFAVRILSELKSQSNKKQIKNSIRALKEHETSPAVLSAIADFENHLIYTININKPPYSIKAIGGERLSDALCRAGAVISMPCGGKGRCGKCRVTVNGKEHLACRTYITEDATVVLPDENSSKIETDIYDRGAEANGSGIGAAVDLGTTTIAVYAVDLSNGEIIAVQAELNEQRAYGADVISRVTYCMENSDGLDALSRIAREQIARMARGAAGGKPIKRMVIAGNTVMEHILLGCDPSGLAAAPFTPVFLNERQTEIDKIPSCTMPCISAYIGGDIIASIIACSMETASEPCLLIDLGTNGEMALKADDTYYCCSVAAGPAFEGGHISCGTGSVAGAVCSVRLDGGLVYADTIDERPSCGICGSGLIDAAAEMLREKLVDSTGRILQRSEQREEWRRYIAPDASAVTLTPTVSITQRDIRELQTAKSAVRAGVETLLKKASLEYGDVKKVFLAGGMGANLPVSSACRIGMLPYEWKGIVQAVGNTAGSGAVSALTDASLIMLAENIRENAMIVELANESEFAELYIKHMNF